MTAKRKKKKTRYRKKYKSKKGNSLAWLFLIPITLVAVLYFISSFTGNEKVSENLENTLEQIREVVEETTEIEESGQDDPLHFPDKPEEYAFETDYPISRKYNLALVKHKTYALGYYEKYEQPLWVQYKLTGWQVGHKRVGRAREFREDPAVPTQSASSWDYSRSGYDRGHLLPSADRRWNAEVQTETFYMSNISPQYHAFNSGIWNALEIQTRKWATKEQKILVITGPAFLRSPQYIGKQNKIAVPTHFYKILIDLTPPYKSLAFFIPHRNKEEFNFFRYKTTIDEIEKKTGLDFLPNLSDSLENYLESRSFFWKK